MINNHPEELLLPHPLEHGLDDEDMPKWTQCDKVEYVTSKVADAMTKKEKAWARKRNITKNKNKNPLSARQMAQVIYTTLRNGLPKKDNWKVLVQIKETDDYYQIDYMHGPACWGDFLHDYATEGREGLSKNENGEDDEEIWSNYYILKKHKCWYKPTN
jgi:hypothetical protein